LATEDTKITEILATELPRFLTSFISGFSGAKISVAKIRRQDLRGLRGFRVH
jgi:hypothetical protein